MSKKIPQHVGLDFGTHTVKAIELSGIDTEKQSLVNVGSQATPHGVVGSIDEKHQIQLADAVKALYDSSGIRNKRVVIALPESSVYTRFVELPGIKEDEIPSVIFYEAKQLLPISIDKVQMSAVKVGFNETQNAFQVLLVAAPKSVVNIYLDVVDRAGLDPIAVETEPVAVGRALYRAVKNEHMVMLDFGAGATDLSIIRNGFLVFSQSIPIGSDVLTQTLINQFNFDYNQAEEYKRNYGVLPDVLEGKVYSALSPVLKSIIVEINKALEFYKTKYLMQLPSKAELCGDGALLPGLADFMTQELGIESEVANPWEGIQIPEKYVNLVDKNHPSYAVAIGLAQKNN